MRLIARVIARLLRALETGLTWLIKAMEMPPYPTSVDSIITWAYWYSIGRAVLYTLIFVPAFPLAALMLNTISSHIFDPSIVFSWRRVTLGFVSLAWLIWSPTLYMHVRVRMGRFGSHRWEAVYLGEVLRFVQHRHNIPGANSEEARKGRLEHARQRLLEASKDEGRTA